MPKHLYHAPADCPVCGDDLIITRKGCLKCGTELAGEFASCSYCALDQADLDLLQVFLSSRGNLREVEKHLSVSYPTARARFDAVIAKLGFTPLGEPATEESTADASDGGEGEDAEPTPSAQEQILARVASGEISSDVAATLLAQL